MHIQLLLVEGEFRWRVPAWTLLLTYSLWYDVEYLMLYSLPTDIQAEGIPMILGGGDVLMVSYHTFRQSTKIFAW